MTFGDVLRVKKDDPRFDLLRPDAILPDSGQPLSIAMHEDLALLWECLWLLIEPQATAAGVDAVEFGKSMGAANLLDARQSLWSEWSDFFQGLQRPDQAKALEIQAAYTKKAIQLVRQRMAGPEIASIESRMEAKMTSIANDTFGSLGASLDSILGPSPGGS